MWSLTFTLASICWLDPESHVAKINFYLLKQDNLQARTALACKLAEQLHRQGLAVQVMTDSEESARELDTLLWQYPLTSFLPHALITENPGADITLCWPATVEGKGNLLNLTEDLPSCHTDVDSIAEFVINDAEAREKSREKWNRYKSFGHQLLHHQL
jgi:DNA polymerase-3 subunit chi